MAEVTSSMRTIWACTRRREVAMRTTPTTALL